MTLIHSSRMSRSVPRRGLSAPATIAIVFVAIVLLVIGWIVYVGWSRTNENTRVNRSGSQLKLLNSAIIAAWNDGVEATPDTLVARGYLGPDALNSRYGPAPDGRGDYWFLSHDPGIGDSEDPLRFIIAYDRAMYASSNVICVVYYHDGHVELLNRDEFEQLITSPPNAGRDFDLPARRRR